jgi:hypothetical protein
MPMAVNRVCAHLFPLPFRSVRWLIVAIYQVLLELSDDEYKSVQGGGEDAS